MLIMQTKLTYKTFYKLLIYVTIIIFYYIHMNRLIFFKNYYSNIKLFLCDNSSY